jgi:hypothetical protein
MIEYNEIFNKNQYSLIFINDNINILYKNELVTNINDNDINEQTKNIITKFINKDITVKDDCCNIPVLQWKLFEIKCSKNKLTIKDCNDMYFLSDSDEIKEFINDNDWYNGELEKFIEYINESKIIYNNESSLKNVIKYNRQFIDYCVFFKLNKKVLIYMYYYLYTFTKKHIEYYPNKLLLTVQQKIIETKEHIHDIKKYKLYDILLSTINNLDQKIIDFGS